MKRPTKLDKEIEAMTYRLVTCSLKDRNVVEDIQKQLFNLQERKRKAAARRNRAEQESNR